MENKENSTQGKIGVSSISMAKVREIIKDEFRLDRSTTSLRGYLNNCKKNIHYKQKGKNKKLSVLPAGLEYIKRVIQAEIDLKKLKLNRN